MLLALAFAVATQPTVAPSFEPTRSYASHDVLGWKVLVSGKLNKERPEVAGKVLGLLRRKLEDIVQAIPPERLPELRKSTIWVDPGIENRRGACYHPDKGWLVENGYNPDKEKAIEISNPDDFLVWTKEQPWMIMHELAHAYHDRVLSFKNDKIKKLYDKAKASGKYDQVLRYNGSKVKHYAMNDPQEYFAEATEAYVGTNDFYPFVKAELKEHDPEMFALLEEIWFSGGRGLLATKTSKSTNSTKTASFAKGRQNGGLKRS